MNVLNRTVLILCLLAALLLATVSGIFAVYVSGSSVVDETKFSYRVDASSPDCHRNHNFETDVTSEELALHHARVQAAKSESHTCHCPFSTTALTPFSNTQLIEIIDIQNSSLVLFSDESSGKTQGIKEQPYRPPIA